jgi:hypothetical protein
MSSDNLKAVESMMKTLGYAKNQMGNNPQAKMMVVQTLKEGKQENGTAETKSTKCSKHQQTD